MRKDLLRTILKETKKEDMKGLTFNPTLEECDYLNEKGIAITKSLSIRTGLISDYNYSYKCFYDTFDFVLDK